MCGVINGRCDIKDDNFTYVSAKGRSVVDYMLTPYDQLCNISNFKVPTMNECVDTYNIDVHSRCKQPDRSLLSCTVNLSVYEVSRQHDRGDDHNPPRFNHIEQREPIQGPNRTHRRYRINVMPDGLFTSDRCRRCIQRIIEDLELQRQDQSGIDAIYDELLESLLTEMDIYLDYKDSTASTHKSSRKHKKPYWNDELRDLWLRTRDSEKVYL